jgi:hypothetical protein
MTRTVISLPSDDKRWLDEQAAATGLPMTALVREAVKLLRAQRERSEPPLEALLEETRGIWPQGDGLAWQEGLRDEW